MKKNSDKSVCFHPDFNWHRAMTEKDPVEGLEQLQAWIDHGLSLNKCWVGNYNLLMWACIYQNRVMMETLIKQNIDIHLKNSSGDTALLCLCHPLYANFSSDAPELVKVLFQAGADMYDKDKEGCSAFHWLAYHNHPSMMEVFIKHGFDLHHVRADGFTPLMDAVQENALDAVRLLLSYGVDLNMQNQNKQTALMMSVIHGHHDIAKLLLESGADWTIQDKDGRNALDLAQTSEYSSLVFTLESLKEREALAKVVEKHGASSKESSPRYRL